MICLTYLHWERNDRDSTKSMNEVREKIIPSVLTRHWEEILLVEDPCFFLDPTLRN